MLSGGIFRIFYSIMSSVNSDSFTSSFPIGISCISFSSLIAMAGTSNIMLNKSGARGHPCLIPDLRGKGFSFSPLSMLAVTLSLLFGHSVLSDSLQPHGLQHTRLSCPSPSPGVCANSCH